MTDQYTRLEANRVYHAKILKVSRERNRSFLKPGTNIRLYVHDITAEDKDHTYKAEYVTETESQNDFHEGITQYFKCSVVGKVGDEIIPFDPEKEKHVPIPAQQNVSSPSSSLPVQSIQGCPMYVHAMNNASIIMASQLHDCPGLSSLDETYRMQLFDLAEDINNWLLAKAGLGA